tara:strand:+ start:29527 stop:29748 length:222 start_codon:yes stop_codon:yes gene_type:complete
VDIDFIKSKDQNRSTIKPLSILGMLWLQTHFESDHWNALSSSKVTLNNSDAIDMAFDARAAGLSINSLIGISI